MDLREREDKPPGDRFGEFEVKMREAGVSEFTLRAFRHNYSQLKASDSGLIPERNIRQIPDLPRLEAITSCTTPNLELLGQTVILKLNGGLGTSMGLDRAKSLLIVRDALTFLDFTVRQVRWLRNRHAGNLRFLLMNSFSTSQETLNFLRQFPELGKPEALELMQSQVPKVDARTLGPIAWPDNPAFEWCPPGHGDIYPSLLSSGLLERLLAEGAKYLFVSNSDNLGANLDLTLLTYFASSGNDFLMEVAERTSSDRKGGHLAERDGKLLLRESAQCPKDDMPAFQDIQQHRSKPIELEVTRYVLGTIDRADRDAKIEKLNRFEDGEYLATADLPMWWSWYNWPAGWSSLNGISQVNWELTLEPEKSIELSYDWHYFWR